jgi:phage terminase large subunit-like protein
MVAMGRQEWVKVMTRREAIIAKERDDPFRYGWESPIWKVPDCLLGLEKYGFIDADYARRMRELLGFEHPVDELLIMGGNRTSKTEYSSKRGQMILHKVDHAVAWFFQTTGQNSRDLQQPLLWRYMPKELRAKIREAVAYISYNTKYGFSDDKFVCPNGSVCSFRNYQQESDTVEGGECDWINPDELIPPDLVDTLGYRLATRAGKMVITFTPVKGYTHTVKLFQDSAQTVRSTTAFMCPKDGGEPDVDRALVRDDPDLWLEGKSSVPEIPEGRMFEKAPRVMKCFLPSRAIMFFHPCDNPYGNPREIANRQKGRSRNHVKERWYGIANKLQSAKFPKFDREIHTLSYDSIPKTGTNYLYVDPAGGRNFFMIWVRVTPECKYIYREWPGSYEIPLQGVPGDWAIPDGKKFDGRKGPAQDGFGFGLFQYKFELARLEGWKDWKDTGCTMDNDDPERMHVEDWDADNGTDEEIHVRYMDSRFASTPRTDNDRPTTLLTRFEDIGIYFEPTPGSQENAEGIDAIHLINSDLSVDPERPIDFFNSPGLMVCEDCRNVIFALENWTGRDGPTGATKDPIDLIRYMELSDADYIDESDYESEGGGHY